MSQPKHRANVNKVSLILYAHSRRKKHHHHPRTGYGFRLQLLKTHLDRIFSRLMMMRMLLLIPALFLHTTIWTALFDGIRQEMLEN